MKSKVSIIILNWNGKSDSLKCLESICDIDYEYFEVIVVDNNSSDDSVSALYQWRPSFEFKKKFRIIENDQNYGFAKGNNIAIDIVLKEGESDYVLLLNNDTVVAKDFLKELVDVMNADTRIGVVGPKLLNLINGEKTEIIQSLGGRINLLRGDISMIGEGCEDFQTEIGEVGYVRGAAIMIRREVFEVIGYLEEKYFAYFEETDFCLRAKRIGYQIKIVPKSVIWHKGMGSFNKISGFSLYLMTRNLFWFEKRNNTSLGYLFFIMYYFLIKFPKKIVYLILIQKPALSVIVNFFKGISHGLFKRI